MKDCQKVYIKGDLKRGDEVIKYLENLGGRNFHSINGKNVNAYYFINPNGIIVNSYLSGSEVFSYVKDFYKEIELPKWKPNYYDDYFYVSDTGKILKASWHGGYTDILRYDLGNCFKTIEEAEEARGHIKEILKK